MQNNIKSIPIFIINLKKDVEKKEHMKLLCDKHGLQVEYIEAVDGSQLSEVEINSVYSEQQAISSIGRGLSRGEIGCALSHMKIYQRMVDENIPKAIVFEDDIVFDESLIQFLNSNYSFPKTLELLLLGYWRKDIKNSNLLISKRYEKKISNAYKIIRFTDIMSGTYAYIITLNGANKLLQSMQTQFYMPIDHYISEEKYINVYGIQPKLVDISTDFELNTALEIERQNLIDTYSKNGRQKLFVILLLKRLGLFRVVKTIASMWNKSKTYIRYTYLRYKSLKKYY